jgi:N-methylhydantoinase A
VTDAHVLLGHITARTLSGGVTLDMDAARAAIGTLAGRLQVAHERVARAMIDIADAAVARALRRVSIERGVDPRDCVLVPFGGGGPLHCCGLAEQLGMRRIFVPPHAGVLSAVGLAITPERRERITSVLAPARAYDAVRLGELLGEMALSVRAPDTWRRQWVARVRYAGQGHELDVPVSLGESGEALALRFAELHGARNGFVLDAPSEIVGLRHVVSGPAHPVSFARRGEAPWSASAPVDSGQLLDLTLDGPAVVALEGATLRIAAGWSATPHATGGWILDAGELP